MAEQAQAEPDQTTTTGQAAPRSSSALVRITVLLFVVAVIGAECLLASLCMPGAHEPSAAAAATTEHEPKSGHSEKEKKESKEGKESGHGKEKKKEEKKEKKGEHGKESKHAEAAPPDAENQVEVDMEQFSVTAHQPTSNTTMRIEFHLYGVINADDKEEFEKLVKASQHRLRDQVLVIVRSADARDLADAGLGLIKRQILEKTNALLGKPILRAVIVSEFSYLEQ